MMDGLVLFFLAHPIPTVVIGMLFTLLMFATVKPWRPR
jgi:hypothetical protein